MNVDRINVYNTKAKENSNEKLKKLISTKSTFTVFTSPSAFDSFIKFYNPNKTKIISIGKTTTKYIESKGYDCMLTSQMQSYEGISASIIKHFHHLWNFQQIDSEDSDTIKFLEIWLRM